MHQLAAILYDVDGFAYSWQFNYVGPNLGQPRAYDVSNGPSPYGVSSATKAKSSSKLIFRTSETLNTHRSNTLLLSLKDEVHSLIERCLMLHMDRDQCIKALAKHARIQPQITLTVWKELMKENKEFFQAYFYAISPRPLINGGVHKIPRFGRSKLWK